MQKNWLPGRFAYIRSRLYLPVSQPIVHTTSIAVGPEQDLADRMMPIHLVVQRSEAKPDVVPGAVAAVEEAIGRVARLVAIPAISSMRTALFVAHLKLFTRP